MALSRTPNGHSGPVAGQEVSMACCCYDAVVGFDLLVRTVEHVERESGPGVDGKAGCNGCPVFGQGGAERPTGPPMDRA